MQSVHLIYSSYLSTKFLQRFSQYYHAYCILDVL
jgi:hypothetical protein